VSARGGSAFGGQFPSTPPKNKTIGLLCLIRHICPILKFIRRGYRPHPRSTFSPNENLRINEFIRAWKVLVIDDEGKMLGEMDTKEAVELAREKGLDLVEVSPKAQPPVCKIIDYGKYQYQKSKEKRLAQGKQKKVEVKEVRIGVKTDDHDLEFKKNQVEKFLSKGHKVKIDLMLRGREKAHQDLARATLQEFISQVSIPYRVEESIKRFPRGFNALISPQ
jgi:translation initiation factor IF-3